MDLQELLSKTFYLWGTLLLLPLWLVIYIKQPSTNSRREMLLSGGILGALAGLFAILYSQGDYWHPPYIFGKWIPFEDVLYGFVYGGVIVELFEYVFNVQENMVRLKRRRYMGTGLFVFTLLGIFILGSVFKLNSVTVYIIMCLLIGIFTVIIRKDLLIPAILSGILVTLLQFIWYWIILAIVPNLFVDYWKMENLTGIMVLKIPLEEIVYAFAVGFGVAHLYEIVTGKQMNF